jgi:hypothetical protein
MAGTTPIRRRLSTFARGVASPFTASRRRGFVTDRLSGVVAAGHVHLSAIARGVSRGAGNIHAVEKRLSRHLGSEHGDASPLAAELPRRPAALVTEDTRLVADTTDLASPTPASWRASGGSTTGPTRAAERLRGAACSRRMCGSASGRCSPWRSSR